MSIFVICSFKLSQKCRWCSGRNIICERTLTSILVSGLKYLRFYKSQCNLQRSNIYPVVRFVVRNGTTILTMRVYLKNTYESTVILNVCSFFVRIHCKSWQFDKCLLQNLIFEDFFEGNCLYYENQCCCWNMSIIMCIIYVFLWRAGVIRRKHTLTLKSPLTAVARSSPMPGGHTWMSNFRYSRPLLSLPQLPKNRPRQTYSLQNSNRNHRCNQIILLLFNFFISCLILNNYLLSIIF